MRKDIPKAGTPAAQARRRATFDPLALTGPQEEFLRRLVATGEQAYGELWKTPLARAISEEVGRTVAPMQIMTWLRGDRPVPDAVVEVLPRLAGRLADELGERAGILRSISDLK